MKDHAAVARSVRLAKAKHPERYCIVPKCLWRTPCPKHCKPSVPRYDYTRTNPNGSGAPWDNDLKMYTDQD